MTSTISLRLNSAEEETLNNLVKKFKTTKSNIIKRSLSLFSTNQNTNNESFFGIWKKEEADKIENDAISFRKSFLG